MAIKVLLVDDDPVIRVLLQDYLSAMKFEVRTLDSGIQCLESLSKEMPDVLLLDFQMPVMNGLEVLRNIRKNSVMHDLPVIMLSADKDTEKYVKEADLQANRYIVKPFEMHAVRDAIKSVCGKK